MPDGAGGPDCSGPLGQPAYAGAAGLAVLGDGQALPVGVRVFELPGHGTFAEPGVRGDFGIGRVVKVVGGGEGVSGDHQARGVAALGGRCERAGDCADVAACNRGVPEGRLNDALFQLGGVDVGTDVALNGDGAAAEFGVARHVGVLHCRFAGGGCTEPHGDDVTGTDVGGDGKAGACAPADTAGVVDLKGDAAGVDCCLGGTDDLSCTLDFEGGGFACVSLVSLDGDEVPVGEDNDVVRESGYGRAGGGNGEHGG
jgi:hypothetical protein